MKKMIDVFYRELHNDNHFKKSIDYLLNNSKIHIRAILVRRYIDVITIQTQHIKHQIIYIYVFKYLLIIISHIVSIKSGLIPFNHIHQPLASRHMP